MFETLAQLFEKCTFFLGRLDYYVQGGMDAKLTVVAYQHLSLFVEICDRAWTIRHSRRSKWKTFMKVTLVSENDVQDLLDRMNSLIDKENGLVGAQTFRHVSVTAANTEKALAQNEQMDGKLDVLVEDTSTRKDRREADDDKIALLRILAFARSPETWDSATQRPIATWETTYHNIRKFHVSRTGEWLLSDPLFQTWANVTKKAPVIGIMGTESSGKSYLASSVIHHLRRSGSTVHSDTRQLVAFCWLGKKKTEIGDIAKSLIWQFADDDASYLQSIANTCRDIGVLDPREILPKLLLDHKALTKVDATFYIIINKLGDAADSVDNHVLDILKKASRSENRAIRIFLTGTPGTFQQLERKGFSCPTMSINDKNKDDVYKFIAARMNNLEALSDMAQPEVQKLRRKIQNELYEKTAGDYFKIDSALNKISSLDYVNDIDDVLKDAGKELTEHIRDEIRRLTEIRTPKELKEINEIILWIVFGEERMSVETMTTVLQWRSGGASLRPLESKFKDKYFLFEVDSDGMVDFRSTKVLKAIPRRCDIAPDEQKNDQNIQTGEVEVVQHFLDKMSPPDLLERLEIKQYLQQKVNRARVHIYQEDPDTAHTQLAAYCLELLTEKLHPRLAKLQEYAARVVMFHLHLVDLAMVDRDAKCKIGPRLVKLFTNEGCIDTLLFSKSVSEENPPWLSTRAAMRAIGKWLKDSAVVSQLDASGKAWVDRSTADECNPFEEVLKPAAMRMAVHCFKKPLSTISTLVAFRFLVMYTDKVIVVPHN